MDTQDFNNIILIIYFISLSAAMFALWVRWVQDDQDRRMDAIVEQYDKIQKQLDRIQIMLDKLEKKKDPFGPR